MDFTTLLLILASSLIFSYGIVQYLVRRELENEEDAMTDRVACGAFFGLTLGYILACFGLLFLTYWAYLKMPAEVAARSCLPSLTILAVLFAVWIVFMALILPQSKRVPVLDGLLLSSVSMFICWMFVITQATTKPNST